MRLLRDLPVKWKLGAVILLTCTVVLLLAGVAYVAYDLTTFRATMIRDLTVLADVIGNNSTAALSFNDPDTGREVLDSLKAHPHIIAACLYADDGSIFARYNREGAAPVQPEQAGADGAHFEREALVLFQPILIDQKRIGTVALRSDLEMLHERVRLNVGVGLLVLAGALLVAIPLSVRLQRVISVPLRSLAVTVQRITEEKNYAMRAEKLATDEIGLLAEGFNQMLDGIEARDKALRVEIDEREKAQEALHQLNVTLEQRVLERTEALHKSEERIRLIVETASDAFVAMTAGGNITEWNPQAEAIFGWSRSAVLEKPLADVMIPPRYREAHRRGLAHYIATGEGPMINKRMEIEGLHKDGYEFPIEMTITALRAGPELLFSAFIHDITERKRAQHALEQQEQELQRSNRDLQEFASVASHDLQEPLRKITAFGDLLKSQAGDSLQGEAREYLERMINAATRMRRLITDLLIYARVSSRPEPFAPLNLNALVQDVLSDIEIALARTHGRVDVEPLPVLEADETQMRQLMQNLIGNGLKFHKPNEAPVVRVYSEPVPKRAVGNGPGADGAEWCKIIVEDNGIGFDDKYKDRIFGVFQRLHSQQAFEGSGIGLAVCKKIVERHGGSIEVSGRQGEGARFSVLLPLKQAGGTAKG